MLRPGAAPRGGTGTGSPPSKTSVHRPRSPRAPSPRASPSARPTVAAGATGARREKKLLEEYAVGATLGEGAFGVVRVCHCRKSGKEFAVKMVDKVETPVPAIMKEAEMLRECEHPNIVKFIDIFIERCFVCIVMEIYKGGDLVDGLQRQGPFDSERIVHIAYQTAAAISHLHTKMVAHRDVKGDNCMLDREDMLHKDCKVVLTDFGTASSFNLSEPFSSQVGTRQFWAPELLDKSYGLSVDVWALGVLMYGLVTGRFPFRDEADIRKKEVKIRTKVEPACKDYILGMLKKDPIERIDAKGIMAHPYLSSMTSKKEEVDAVADGDVAEAGVPQMIREDGANVGIKDRRNELLERLHQEHDGKKPGHARKASTMDFQPFTAESKTRPGERHGYEWWGPEKTASIGLLDILSKAQPVTGDSGRDSNDLTLFSTMLEEHGIDPSKFGTGTTKSLQTLASEVRSGEARLMLDATAHKKLVRVVDIVVLRLRCEEGDRFVVEVSVDSSDRGKYETMRLPAKIKPPHENTKRCCERVLSSLGLEVAGVNLHLEDRELCEEEYESPSYPGVQTIYRKEIVEGVVNSKALSAEQARGVGLPDFAPWAANDSSGTRACEWMSAEQAAAKNVQFYAKGAGGEVVSSLVHAPIGMNEQELEARLTSAGIDVSKFGQHGTRTLKEFSQELYRGEAFLATNETGELVRTVNVVLIVLVSSQTRATLVQTHQIDAKGMRQDKPRLPGNKCRPDENHFICARNSIRKEIDMDDQSLVFDETVKFIEEQTLSSNYPGIKTIYRKFIVTANL